MQELYLKLITQLRENPTAISVCPCCNQKDMGWELFASYFRTVISLVPCMENENTAGRKTEKGNECYFEKGKMVPE